MIAANLSPARRDNNAEPDADLKIGDREDRA